MNRITIGRSNTNDVILPDPSVSRRHAELRSDGGGRYFLIDLDSTNGTYVRDGGEWVRIRQGFVAADERVQFGELVTTLGTLLGDGADAPAAAPEEPGERDDVIDETPPPSLMLDDERQEPAFRSYQDYLAEQDVAGGEAMRQETVDLHPARPRRGVWVVAGAALAAVLAAAAAGAYFWLTPGPANMTEAEPAAAPPTSGETWQQSFGGADVESAHGLAVLTGGDLAVAASSMREGAPESRLPWLLAVAPDGPERWSFTPEGARGQAQALAPLPDGGLLAVGGVSDTPGGTLDGWIARFDADGAVAWSRTYASDMDFAFNGVVPLDGGAVLAGTTHRDGTGDGLLTRIDDEGDTVWEKPIGGEGRQALYHLAAASDGSFLAAGIDDSGTAGGDDGWLVKFDADGEILWQANAGGGGIDNLVAVQGLPDGGAVAVGRSRPEDGEDFDPWVVWFDADGAVTLERRLDGDGHYAAAALAPTADGGLLVGGAGTAGAGGPENAWLLKLDATNGQTLWERRFGGTDVQYKLRGVAALPDGGIAVAGQMRSDATAGPDVWLARLDAEGRF